MANLHPFIAISFLAPCAALAGPGLDQAEVKLPYGELKSLIARAAGTPVAPAPEPALLLGRLRFTMVAGKLVIDATFRTTTFADGLAMIPLIGGNVTVKSHVPADARIVIHDKMLSQAVESAGAQLLEMRLLPAMGPEGARLALPACPALMMETGDLGEDRALELKIGGREQVLGSNQNAPLPLTGGDLEIRLLGGDETREALRPPEPSDWSWQHQALVVPADGEIFYQVLARASASGGSGVSAVLGLPVDAREVRVTGEDVVGREIVRGADRSQNLQVEWKTRGQLEREITISYQMPRRPLDRSWKLSIWKEPQMRRLLSARYRWWRPRRQSSARRSGR